MRLLPGRQSLLRETAKEKYGDGGARQIPEILRLLRQNFKTSLETRYKFVFSRVSGDVFSDTFNCHVYNTAHLE